MRRQILTVNKRTKRRTRCWKDMELRLILGKESAKSFLKKLGLTIATAETVATGIRRYKLLIAKSNLPSANKSIRAAIAAKRQAYGTALVMADISFPEDSFIINST
ncbi:MAG: hypothetical protein MUO99_06815 [Dehalococcoidales bacterium]|nr:hypothetical protein [Dehalococcoidales bacterium]